MLKETIEELRNEHGEYCLSEIKRWAAANEMDYRGNPFLGTGDNYIMVFARSYSPTYQVFICKSGELIEISAI